MNLKMFKSKVFITVFLVFFCINSHAATKYQCEHPTECHSPVYAVDDCYHYYYYPWSTYDWGCSSYQYILVPNEAYANSSACCDTWEEHGVKVCVNPTGQIPACGDLPPCQVDAISDGISEVCVDGNCSDVQMSISSCQGNVVANSADGYVFSSWDYISSDSCSFIHSDEPNKILVNIDPLVGGICQVTANFEPSSCNVTVEIISSDGDSGVTVSTPTGSYSDVGSHGPDPVNCSGTISGTSDGCALLKWIGVNGDCTFDPVPGLNVESFSYDCSEDATLQVIAGVGGVSIQDGGTFNSFDQMRWAADDAADDFYSCEIGDCSVQKKSEDGCSAKYEVIADIPFYGSCPVWVGEFCLPNATAENCSNFECVDSQECSDDSECDYKECYNVHCGDDYICIYEEIPDCAGQACTDSSGCDDGNPKTLNVCGDDGVCTYPPDPGDEYDSTQGCECGNDAGCDDGDDGTYNLCKPVDGGLCVCSFPPIESGSDSDCDICAKLTDLLKVLKDTPKNIDNALAHGKVGEKIQEIIDELTDDDEEHRKRISDLLTELQKYNPEGVNYENLPKVIKDDIVFENDAQQEYEDAVDNFIQNTDITDIKNNYELKLTTKSDSFTFNIIGEDIVVDLSPYEGVFIVLGHIIYGVTMLYCVRMILTGS